MGTDSLTASFLRHVEVVLSNIDYAALSRRGSRAANAYRLAKKELRQLQKKKKKHPSCAAVSTAASNHSSCAAVSTAASNHSSCAGVSTPPPKPSKQ